MMEKATESDNFKISAGMLVEVLTMSNKLTFVGKVTEYTRGTLTIQDSTGRETPPVMYNKEIKLRFFRGNRSLVAFGKICGSSPSIWKVDRLEKKNSEEKRAFFRQSVNLKASAQCLHGSASAEQNAMVQRIENSGPVVKSILAPCSVLDVSAGGLLICTRVPYQFQDRLMIQDAKIVPEMDSFSFICGVRRVGQDGPNYLCGCQFEGLADREQDRLLQAIFIIQRKEIQMKKAHL